MLPPSEVWCHGRHLLPFWSSFTALFRCLLLYLFISDSWFLGISLRWKFKYIIFWTLAIMSMDCINWNIWTFPSCEFIYCLCSLGSCIPRLPAQLQPQWQTRFRVGTAEPQLLSSTFLKLFSTPDLFPLLQKYVLNFPLDCVSRSNPPSFLPPSLSDHSCLLPFFPLRPPLPPLVGRNQSVLLLLSAFLSLVSLVCQARSSEGQITPFATSDTRN